MSLLERLFRNPVQPARRYRSSPITYVAATDRSSPSIISTNSSSTSSCARSIRRAISGVAAGSSTTKSAGMPGAKLPRRSSSPSARAPPSVAR